MSIDTSDPRLTAYALGELSKEEAAEIERLIGDDPAARAEVREIRDTAETLRLEFSKEPPAALDDARVRKIARSAATQDHSVHRPAILPAKSSGWLGWGLGSFAFGGVCLVCLFFLASLSERSSYREVRSMSVSLPEPKREAAAIGAGADSYARSAPQQLAALPSPPPPGQAGGAGRLQQGPMAAGRPAPDRPRMKEDSSSGTPAEVTAPSSESYDTVAENPFLTAAVNPLSTFSIDVDTAAYSNVRRFIQQGMRPPRDAVRIEELINYFVYDYAAPDPGEPLTVHAEVAGCPWATDHRLVRIGVKGREMAADARPRSNLVFLLDVSGSMDAQNRLPLVKEGLKLLVNQLGENDSVAIAVYAGASGLVLPPTSGHQRGRIIGVLDELKAGGSTNGGAGIQLAYDTAVSAFIKGGNNRVIIATDGDFNVGVTDKGDLVRYVEQKAKSGVFLTVLGFGMGNLKEATLEQLADKGNGNFAYIDNLAEARKVLVEQMVGTLVTIAKDVKIQVEFNPARVAAYRQIGYENRALKAEDFRDDKKDAGELGAGHTVTALYEIVPVGKPHETPGVDPLKYQATVPTTTGGTSPELMTVKLRFKEPTKDKSQQLDFGLTDSRQTFDKASVDLRFAAGVAAFGMLLRDSPHKGSANLSMVEEICKSALGRDPSGYRAEFVELVNRARDLIAR